MSRRGVCVLCVCVFEGSLVRRWYLFGRISSMSDDKNKQEAQRFPPRILGGATNSHGPSLLGNGAPGSRPAWGRLRRNANLCPSARSHGVASAMGAACARRCSKEKGEEDGSTGLSVMLPSLALSSHFPSHFPT
jgi:hypothetical protein